VLSRNLPGGLHCALFAIAGRKFKIAIVAVPVVQRIKLRFLAISIAAGISPRKIARPSGRRFATSQAEIFVQRVISPHIGGNFRSRARHCGSPLLSCQTLFGIIPDVASTLCALPGIAMNFSPRFGIGGINQRPETQPRPHIIQQAKGMLRSVI
jgi:hypothetical protein